MSSSERTWLVLSAAPPSLTLPVERRRGEESEGRRSESDREEENKNNDNRRKHQLQPPNIIGPAERHPVAARFKFQDAVSIKQGCASLTRLLSSPVSVLSALVHREPRRAHVPRGSRHGGLGGGGGSVF